MKRSLVFRALAIVGLIALALSLSVATPAPAADVGSNLILAHASPLTLPSGGLIPTQLASALTSASQATAVVVSSDSRLKVFDTYAIPISGERTDHPELVRLWRNLAHAGPAAGSIDLLAQPPNPTST